MRKLISLFLLAMVPVLGWAGGGNIHLDHADIDPSDQASLQRGAKFFVNYCMGCHSAKYQRYNRMAQDIGLTEEQVKANLMFTTEKIGDTMEIAMSSADANKFFGTTPPDLSLIARSRGVDWLYTYLRSFYIDEARPTGVNNVVFKDVGMPHVMWDLQGWQKAIFKENEHGGDPVFERFELVKPGAMTPEQFDGAIRDLVNFLDYVGEPYKLERQRLGVKVLLFLAIFFVLAYLLKKEYWKDVH